MIRPGDREAAMVVDEGRWRGLVDELTDLSSIRRGANAQLAELHERADRQRSQLGRLEDQRRTRTGQDLAADVTLADLAHPPPRDQRVPYPAGQADYDRSIVEGRVQLAELDADIARLDRRLDPVRVRLAALDQLRRRCLDWAAAQTPAVSLPERGAERMTATLPEPTGAPRIFDLPDPGQAAAGFAAAGPAAAPPGNGLGRLGDFIGRHLGGQP
jgi:hypothetical protein